jgi:hypothetical protein
LLLTQPLVRFNQDPFSVCVDHLFLLVVNLDT